MFSTPKTSQGQPAPLGATVTSEGVNFSIYSKNATAVELLLFSPKNTHEAKHIIHLDPITNRTTYYWHVLVHGLKHGQIYGYRVYGPYTPEEGLRFDGNKILIDPYAKGVVTDDYDRNAAVYPGNNIARAVKSVVLDTNSYDWEGDQPLQRELSETIIYELHVKGFTKHPSSGLSEDVRGTYKGLIEKIPYLKSLGINAVELMPIHQFDPKSLPNQDLTNYWGYNTIAFFAPHNEYASVEDPGAIMNEFRDMVKAFHKAGIAVLLDVVFNHTGEGDESGPTLSFRGLENRAYYILEENKAHYKNFSGTGNTVKAHHSVVRRFIIDCLKFWVKEYHIDGFRFDLASVLSRDENGEQTPQAPILWSIDSDPELAGTQIIAESWDIQLYQLGNFVGERWGEWNGAFRDDVRKFVKGNQGMVYALRNRLTASNDIFQGLFKDPNLSINFVTCHDGFTLNDLVSYNQKWNFQNGENNRDGANDNHSWNWGVEGPTDDPKIEATRHQLVKNFFTILFISQGTPMLSMGDEMRRTQMGNNNAYCQDNEISWLDWSFQEKYADLFKFLQGLIHYNTSLPFFREKTFWLAPKSNNLTQIQFHGIKLNEPDWGHYSHTLAFTLSNRSKGLSIHAMINAFHEPLTFEIPNDNMFHWKSIIDTAATAPNDIFLPENAPFFQNDKCELKERSIRVLLSDAKVKPKRGWFF